MRLEEKASILPWIDFRRIPTPACRKLLHLYAASLSPLVRRVPPTMQSRGNPVEIHRIQAFDGRFSYLKFGLYLTTFGSNASGPGSATLIVRRKKDRL